MASFVLLHPCLSPGHFFTADRLDLSLAHGKDSVKVSILYTFNFWPLIHCIVEDYLEILIFLRCVPPCLDFCSAGDQPQGFMHSRQPLYQTVPRPQPRAPHLKQLYLLSHFGPGKMPRVW